MARDESRCGEDHDHDQEVTYEDDETLNWSCRCCGAEGWYDK